MYGLILLEDKGIKCRKITGSIYSMRSSQSTLLLKIKVTKGYNQVWDSYAVLSICKTGLSMHCTFLNYSQLYIKKKGRIRLSEKDIFKNSIFSFNHVIYRKDWY